LADVLLRLLFPGAPFAIWPWLAQDLPGTVRLPFLLAILVATELKLCVITPFSIGAVILSYHVFKFMLITAFFLFSMGYLDMTLGLVS